MIARILLALDDATLQSQLKKRLSRPDVLVDVPRSRRHIWKRINRETCDMVVLSASFVPRPREDMIAALAELPDTPTLVLLTEGDDPEDRAALLAAGADEVLYSGVSPGALFDVFTTILDKRRELTVQSLTAPRQISQPRLTDFVSLSPVMQDFMSMVQRVVPSNTSLLLQGETGVGKERLARAIHMEGPRSDGPFIAINCGALPDSLLESELFGHEEGAFTGATRSRRGCFEMAHLGTIFLDEIGEMPLHVQNRLLRVLQEHEVQRLGGELPVRVDVRVVAATNRDLQQDVEERRFRSDLFYRLSVVTLTVPPLRERREDIRELAESYLDYLRPRVGRDVLGITEESLERMEEYDWPGNVRELINVVERAMLLCDEEITLKNLPDGISGIRAGEDPAAAGRQPESWDDVVLPDTWLELPLGEVKRQVVAGFERAYLAGLLERTRGRVGETASLAGITPRALYGKMRRHDLKKEDFKTSA